MSPEFWSLRLSIFRLLAPLSALAVATSGCARDNPGNDQGNAAPAAPKPAVIGEFDRSHSGTPAPTFTFEDGEGRPASMADFRGKPTLVNLWATWCAPCIVEMPSLDRLAAREGEALNVVALSQDLAGREAVARFFGERKFQVLEANLDSEMKFMTALKIDTLPATILYDADGKEVWRMVGPAEWDGERVAPLLDEAEGG